MKIKEKTSETIDGLKRAFVEFLTLPTLLIAGFLLLAFFSYLIDKAEIGWLQPLRQVLKQHVFANAKATSDLLGAIAAGIISVTSITITLLLIVSRKAQLKMIEQTLRTPGFQGKFSKVINSEKHGYVTKIDIEKMGAAIHNKNESEVVLYVSIGTYIAYGDELALIHTDNQAEVEPICKGVLDAIHLYRQRDVDYDAAYGIEQLQMIAWTNISTSKSNPAPGLLTIRSLRNILARWSLEETENNRIKLPIVYNDNTIEKLMETFETLAVVSSESMQHQNFIEVLTTITTLFDRLKQKWQDRVEDMLLRIISALGDHVLTAELEKALSDLINKLNSAGRTDTAIAIENALHQLSKSVGKLNSRATRVPGGS